MNVTIQDAINAFALLQEHVNENGFLHECYNLGISALKTIQDGNYQLQEEGNKYQKEIEEIANYDCTNSGCDKNCPYFTVECENMTYSCASIQAREVVKGHNDIRKELEAWIQENY